MQDTMAASSSRILYDVPCAVCRDYSSGKHYGVYACDGCSGFFKRSVRRERSYACKAPTPGRCLVDKVHRNQCRACRLVKCLDSGMNKDAVQHERGPRNSTIRRQRSLYLKGLLSPPPDAILPPSSTSALNLALPKHHTLLTPPMRPITQPFPVNMYNYQQGFTFLANGPLNIPSPASIGPLEPESICEAAARLLFMNVKWARNLPAFSALSLSDRLLLLQECWSELFVLGAAQFLVTLDMKSLIKDQSQNLANEMNQFLSTLVRIAQHGMDTQEYVYLRGAILFKTSVEGTTSPGLAVGKRLQDPRAVAAAQDYSKLVLNDYINSAFPSDQSRFGRLMLLLPIIKSVSSTTIEALFFRKTIGNIRIERIISDMYMGGKDE